MTKDEALDLALDALGKSDGFLYNWHENATDDEADAYATARQLNEKAITAIKQARSAPVQKPTTVEDNSQDWAGMDGATAWHLIDRHADGWADVAKMMGEWLAANTPPAAPVQESEKRECMNCAAFGECNPNNDAGRCGYEPPAAQRQWAGLTDEDLANCSGHEVRWALYWEKLLKGKNT